MEDIGSRHDKVAVERRTIEIRKLGPNDEPETEVVDSDAPEKLNDLLERLKAKSCRNGRYAVYLTEVNLADGKAAEPRMLMKIYKSGNTLGDPVHEPGPGDNPLDGLDHKTRGEKQEMPPPLPAQTRAMEPRGPSTAGSHPAAHRAAIVQPLNTRVPASAKAPEAKSASSHAAIRYPMVAAAVAAMGGLGAQSLQEGWASRVDEALGGGETRSLGRAARLSRLLRKSKK